MQPSKLVILNLWHKEMVENESEVSIELDLPFIAQKRETVANLKLRASVC